MKTMFLGVIIVAIIALIAIVSIVVINDLQEQLKLEALENQWNQLLIKAQECNTILSQQPFLDMDFSRVNNCNDELHEMRVVYDIMDLKYQGYSTDEIMAIQEAHQKEIEENNKFWNNEMQIQINNCKSTWIGQLDMQERCIEKVQTSMGAYLQKDYLR